MFRIVLDNEKSLREKSVFVDTPLNKEDEELAFKMLEYLKNGQDEEYRKKHPEIKEGVGLAAPQVGVNRKIIAVYFPKEENEDGTFNMVTHLLANPRITSNSVRKCYLSGGEGCLSVEEKHPGKIYRDYKIVVNAFDVIAKRDVNLTARGYEAIVLQHEIDHLDGVLYYDHLNYKLSEKDKNDALEI